MILARKHYGYWAMLILVIFLTYQLLFNSADSLFTNSPLKNIIVFAGILLVIHWWINVIRSRWDIYSRGDQLLTTKLFHSTSQKKFVKLETYGISTVKLYERSNDHSSHWVLVDKNSKKYFFGKSTHYIDPTIFEKLPPAEHINFFRYLQLKYHP